MSKTIQGFLSIGEARGEDPRNAGPRTGSWAHCKRLRPSFDPLLALANSVTAGVYCINATPTRMGPYLHKCDRLTDPSRAICSLQPPIVGSATRSLNIPPVPMGHGKAILSRLKGGEASSICDSPSIDERGKERSHRRSSRHKREEKRRKKKKRKKDRQKSKRRKRHHSSSKSSHKHKRKRNHRSYSSSSSSSSSSYSSSSSSPPPDSTSIAQSKPAPSALRTGVGAAATTPAPTTGSEWKKKIKKISDKDYYGKNKEFGLWIKQNTGRSFAELNSFEANRYFSRFVDQWNSGALPKDMYGEEVLDEGEAYSKEMARIWSSQAEKYQSRQRHPDMVAGGPRKKGKDGGGVLDPSTVDKLVAMELQGRVRTMNLMSEEECASVLIALGPEDAAHTCMRIERDLAISSVISMAKKNPQACAATLPHFTRGFADSVLEKMDRDLQQRIVVAKSGSGMSISTDSDFESSHPELARLSTEQLRNELMQNKGYDKRSLPLTEQQRVDIEMERRAEQRRKQLEINRAIKKHRADDEEDDDDEQPPPPPPTSYETKRTMKEKTTREPFGLHRAAANDGGGGGGATNGVDSYQHDHKYKAKKKSTIVPEPAARHQHQHQHQRRVQMEEQHPLLNDLTFHAFSEKAAEDDDPTARERKMGEHRRRLPSVASLQSTLMPLPTAQTQTYDGTAIIDDGDNREPNSASPTNLLPSPPPPQRRPKWETDPIVSQALARESDDVEVQDLPSQDPSINLLKLINSRNNNNSSSSSSSRIGMMALDPDELWRTTKGNIELAPQAVQVPKRKCPGGEPYIAAKVRKKLSAYEAGAEEKLSRLWPTLSAKSERLSVARAMPPVIPGVSVPKADLEVWPPEDEALYDTQY
eukprot:jgi/Bigna1/71593/fgenesh1_pg.16_\